MTDELKACPFCGRIPTRDHWAIYCELCWAEKGNLNEAEWNTRPLEDALLARAERAEDILTRLIAEIDPGTEIYYSPDPPISAVHAWFLRMKRVANEWRQR